MILAASVGINRNHSRAVIGSRCRRASEEAGAGDDGGEGSDLQRPSCATRQRLVEEHEARSDRTTFVTRVAMPAAVSALPCWNPAWSTLVPAA